MTGCRTFAVLPHGGTRFVCATSDDRVEPLIPAPGDHDARYALSEDGCRLAVLDRKATRAGLFALLPAAPWLSEILPMAPLPDGCTGHAILPLHDTLLVGGHGPRHEALWQRSLTTASWTAIGLPEDILQHGKAVDGLHLRGEDLIVVDDIVTPKWLLLYDVRTPSSLAHSRTIRLPHHTTYERIIDSCLGTSGLWCLSKGINHGVSSTHIWRLDTHTFQELGHWSAQNGSRSFYRSVFDTPPGNEVVQAAQRQLLSCVSMIEANGQILLACGPLGLGRLLTDHAKQGLTPVEALDTPTLASVDAFVCPAPWDGRGVFLVGQDSNGKGSCVWWRTT